MSPPWVPADSPEHARGLKLGCFSFASGGGTGPRLVRYQAAPTALMHQEAARTQCTLPNKLGLAESEQVGSSLAGRVHTAFSCVLDAR